MLLKEKNHKYFMKEKRNLLFILFAIFFWNISVLCSLVSVQHMCRE